MTIMHTLTSAASASFAAAAAALASELGGSQGGAEGRHWVLDPIDGTRGFVGMRQYAVCLGMLQVRP
jgi:3'-phosphoadenosine 5'-phosphosulfate (PAPS) 3'-phosphatase